MGTPVANRRYVAPAPGDMRDLYVDLDGTLLRSDLLIESALRYVLKNPLRVFRLLLLMLRGPAAMKTFLARRIKLDPSLLPYETDLIDYLKLQRSHGCRIVLATASHWTHARRIARHLGCFDAVLATGARRNLKGRSKLEAILARTSGYAFDYAGDSSADRPLWDAADRALFVNAPQRDARSAERLGRADLVLRTRPPAYRAFLNEMRLHQWTKNILLFVPLLTSHTYTDPSVVGHALIAFLAFGLCASGHYFLNDLLDLDADRIHATKRTRPIASGDLPISTAVVGAILLPCISFALAILLLPAQFAWVLAAYLAITVLYSFRLKRVQTADVMTLAILYTIRIVAGAAVIPVVLSSWLLAFSVFTFVGLAYLKRYVEISKLDGADTSIPGRGYSTVDLQPLFVLGIASGIASTVVLALYISSDDVTQRYRYPDILWLLCLLVLYWNNRIWIGARRGDVVEDPIVFAIKDKVSRLIGLAGIAVMLVARLWP